MQKILDEILPYVRKPSRYINQEVNSVKKDHKNVKVKFALVFPDTYEIGMSHVGIHLLYHILNRREDILCERVFSPGDDFESILIHRNIPLFSLESQTPLKAFDIVGFSLSYELAYTNVLNILKLCKIPFLSRQRDDEFPLIIAGGPVMFNPEPVADIFDAIVIGDGEEVVEELCDRVIECKTNGCCRESLLKSLDSINGVYVPSLFDTSYLGDGTIKIISHRFLQDKRVKKRIVKDLDTIHYPRKPLVPFTDIVHNRLTIEIFRGCNQGCRFCQAGMIYRPVRERGFEALCASIDENLRTTGYEEISLLSLNSGGYSHINALLQWVLSVYYKKRVVISLPSLRVDTLSAEIAKKIATIKRTGFTIAPEAGSQKLRDLINKRLTEEQILRTITKVFELGWNNLKLYFMIGLPKETDDDLSEIARLARKASNIAKKFKQSNTITVNISPFIPKPHTPFQWLSQQPLEVIEEKLNSLKNELKRRNIRVKWHSPYMSVIEGAFSRGDRRLNPLLINAFQRGCKFDAWSKHFHYELWQEAFSESGMDLNFYTFRERPYDEVLPWDHIDSLIDKRFLIKELEKAFAGVASPDCGKNECLDCGVCESPRVSSTHTIVEKQRDSIELDERHTGERYRYRVKYQKMDDMRFLSHLELSKVLQRAMFRANVPLHFSKGFHPLPKISFGYALALGVESAEEYFDMECSRKVHEDEVISSLNRQLPKGIKILTVKNIPIYSKGIIELKDTFVYTIPLDGLERDSLPKLMSNDEGDAKRKVVMNAIEKIKIKDDTMMEVTVKNLS
ncbi:MAG: TIGR03960 family B12-binding radical SAM protein, partial [Thermodesulfobacteriota bacterium]|nr:TIGR03960 family B12-binding radical SAM protein [Thermodesulfobacteriota bacterium]